MFAPTVIADPALAKMTILLTVPGLVHDAVPASIQLLVNLPVVMGLWALDKLGTKSTMEIKIKRSLFVKLIFHITLTIYLVSIISPSLSTRIINAALRPLVSTPPATKLPSSSALDRVNRFHHHFRQRLAPNHFPRKVNFNKVNVQSTVSMIDRGRRRTPEKVAAIQGAAYRRAGIIAF